MDFISKVLSFNGWMLFFIFFYSCNSPTNSQHDNSAECIIVDLDIPKTTSIQASSLFKNVKTIILETNDLSLIGHISDLQVFDGFLYVLDTQVAKSLFVFDLNGNFIRKIGKIGRGPGEYSNISDFTIDSDNKQLFLLDQDCIHKYKITDGSFMGSTRIRSENTSISCIQYFNHALFTDACNYSSTIDDCLLMKINLETGNVVEKYLKPSQYNKGWNETYSKGRSFFINRMNGTPKYVQIFMETIISLDGVSPFISLRSKNMVTINDIDVIKKEDNFVMRTMAVSNIPQIHYIHNYVENDNFIYFEYKHGVHYYSTMYDVKSGSTQIFEGIKNDLLFKNGEGFLKLDFSDKKGVYEVVNPGIIDLYTQYAKENLLVSTLDKLEDLKKLDEESNPVIFYYTYNDAE